MPLTEQEEFELMELERQYALEMEREAQSATPSEPEKPSLGKQISKRGEQFAESVMGVPRYTMERPGVVERAAGAAGAVGGIVGDLGGAVLSPVISAGAKGASEASKITWLKKLSDAGRFLPVVQSAYALPDLAKMAGDVKLPSGLKAKEVPGEFVRGITPMVKESVKNIPEGEKRFYGDILDASNLVGLGIGETAIKKLADVAAKKSLAKTFAKKGLSEVVEQAPIISKKMIRQEGIKQTKGKGGVVGAIFNQYQITPQQVAALTDPKAPATIPLTKYARQERLHLAPPIGKIYQPNAGELAGSQATRAMNDLDLLRKIKGQELEKLIAKNADTPIDLTDIKAKYADDLAKVLGAQVEKTTTEQGIKTVVKNIPGKTVLMPGYSGKITQAQNLLDSVGDITNVGQAQYLKRALNQLTWDKTAAGYAKNTEMDAIIKPLIRELDNKINSLIPDAAYRKINSEYGQIKNVYDNFYKRVGPSLGIAFETAEEDIGRHAMSVMKRAVESGQDSNIRTIFQNVSQLLPEYDLMQDAHYASIVMKAMGDTNGIPLHQNLANAVLGRSVPQQAFEATKKGISGTIDPLTNIEKLWIKEQARKGGFNQVVYPTNDLKKMLDELRTNKTPSIKREIKKVSFEDDPFSGMGELYSEGEYKALKAAEAAEKKIPSISQEEAAISEGKLMNPDEYDNHLMELGYTPEKSKKLSYETGYSLRQKFFPKSKKEIDLSLLSIGKQKELSNFVEDINLMHDNDYSQWLERFGKFGFPDKSDLHPDDIIDMINQAPATRKEGGSALGIMGLPALREPSPAGYDAATQALLRTGAGGAAGMGASLALDKDATPQEHVGRGLAGALAGFGAPGLYRMAKSGFREGPFGAKAGQIPAWHGSPHKFDKFGPLEKVVGTGEGAQAFGHGLYFTSEKDIAKHYAKTLNKKEVINPLNFFDDKNVYASEAVEVGKRYYKNGQEIPRQDFVAAFKSAQKKVDEQNAMYGENLYSVTLHKGKTPDQYDYLKWGEKLTPSQVDKIDKAIEEYASLSQTDKYAKNRINNMRNDLFGTGESGTSVKPFYSDRLYHSLSRSLGSDKAASDFLLRAGIDGIEYPAGSLSGVSSKARNYVVFDPEAVTIEAVNDQPTTNVGKMFGSNTGAVGAGVNPQVHTPEFKAWFGDWQKAPEKASKVVDAEGKPLVVYHGTGTPFSKFSPKKIGTGAGDKSQGAYFFTSEPKVSDYYARMRAADGPDYEGANVKPVFLDIKNPYHSKLEYYNTMEVAEEIAKAKKLGHDGVIFDKMKGETERNQMAVFSPTQIKSATGNSGAFDPTNPDIRGNTALPMLGMTGAGAGGLLTLGAMAERAMNKKKGSK